MKCREVRKTLVAYLDGEVAPSERRAIDMHLARCESCEKEFLTLGKTRIRVADGMQQLASQAVPAKNAWIRLHTAIPLESISSLESPTTTTVFKPPGRRTLSRRSRFVLVAVATVLVAVGVGAAVPATRSAASQFLTGLLNHYQITPVEAGYLPEGFDPVPVYQVGSVAVPSEDGQDGGNQLAAQSTQTGQSLYRSGKWFVLIRTSSNIDRPLPEGQTANVNGDKAVLVTGLSGVVPAPEQLLADQGTSAAAVHEYSITYRDANALTWNQEGVRVEVLSNLPVEEIVRIAEGLVPAGLENGIAP